LRQYHALGIRLVWIGTKQDLGPRDHSRSSPPTSRDSNAKSSKRGPGPWALALSPSGLRPLNLKQL
jgi:hypothetical protein